MTSVYRPPGWMPLSGAVGLAGPLVGRHWGHGRVSGAHVQPWGAPGVCHCGGLGQTVELRGFLG